MFSTPYLLEMTRDECRGMLRRLELECYSSVLNAFRAQGSLNQNKSELLQSLRNVFNISQERHRAEARRVANDEKLCTIADTICGSNTYYEWLKEGRRHYPLSRSIPLTSLSYISNKVVKSISKRNGKILANNSSESMATEEVLGANDILEKSCTRPGSHPESNINLNKDQQPYNPQKRKHLENPNSRIQYLYHVHNMSLLKKRKDGLKKLKNISAQKRKICKSFNQSENKSSNGTELLQSEEIATTGVGNESTDLQIATSKKDISVNFSKLNSLLLTQKQITLKDDAPKMPLIQKSVINVNNKVLTSSNVAVSLQSPKKIDSEFHENIVINSDNCNTTNQIVISDNILNTNEDFIHKSTDDNELTNISFITTEPNSNLAMKGNVNAMAVKKIAPLIVRNIKLPNNIHIRGDRNKKHLSIVSTGARKVFIQPNKEFQKRYNNTNFINTIKTSHITPLNIKTTDCTTFKKISPLTNINMQQLNIKKPNMVILQTNQRNQSGTTNQSIKLSNLDTGAILPIQGISGFQKKKVFVIGSIANADNSRIQSKKPNIETKSNIITEDTPVDILPLNDFYMNNFNYEKVNIANEVSSNILTSDTIYQEEIIDTEDCDPIIGTTDWELALDEEVNKSKENNLQYREKNLYSAENTVILSSNSNNTDNFHDLSEDIIDETYEYTNLSINEA